MKAQKYQLKGTYDLDPLLEKIGNSNFVLLGEASHGTHEYFTWRAEISKRLIEEKGFSVIAVEGDWPDCFQINKWIKGFNDSPDNIIDVLKAFKRWPTWMWGNWEIAAFAKWLRQHNLKKEAGNQVGFYGLDIYSLWDSMETIIKFLEEKDPETAKHARKAIDCFEPYKAQDSYSSVRGEYSCKDEVVSLLQEVRKKISSYSGEREAGLNAEINSLVMKNAEEYYRAMASFSNETWNIRDSHMVDSLEILLKHHHPDTKVIIWEHNTHIGDARATNMAAHGLHNVGQLVREKYGKQNVCLVGFGCYQGSVIAGDSWGAKMKKMPVPKAIQGSFEYGMHKSDSEDTLLIFEESSKHSEICEAKQGHRAIGVVYDPGYERGNYVPSKMCDRYDAFLYFDKTQALHPLHLEPDGSKEPETFPFGI